MLKSGEQGLVDPGSNNYGKDDRPLKGVKREDVKDQLIRIGQEEIDRLEGRIKELELINKGLEEGSEQWKARYENLLICMQHQINAWNEIGMTGAAKDLTISINHVQNIQI